MVSKKRPKDFQNVQWEQEGIVAFDQSIAKAGWSVLTFGMQLGIKLWEFGTIRTGPEDSELSGVPATLERGDILHDEASDIIARYEGFKVVHEWPTRRDVYGRQGNAGEHGFIAATAVRTAARRNGRVAHGIAANTMKRAVTGNGKAEKPEVGAAVLEIICQPDLRTNEDVRDSIGMAIGFMVVEGRWVDVEA